ELELAASVVLPLLGRLGCARGLAAALGPDPEPVDRRGRDVEPEAARRLHGTGIRGTRLRELRIPPVHAAHVQSVRPRASGTGGRPRPESAAAGFRPDRASA